MQKSETNYNMIDWWKKVVIENYANFTGRARRSEYWYFALGQVCIIIPFYAIGITGAINDNPILTTLGLGLCGIIWLATFIPALAVMVRRLHDVGRSGWFYFIALIPLIGSIILLIWFFTEGNRFANNWGEDPKNPDGPVFDFEQPQGL